jgi:cytochrome c oxidase subunit 1
MAFFAGLYYWFPKMSGKLMDERIGKLGFWFLVPGLHLIFFPQHIAGLMGMPRRTQTYVAGIGLELPNLISTAGTFVMLIGLILLLVNIVHGLLRGKPAGNDPWDARTLEWATSSPPPHHNFDQQPVVTDRDAFWAQKYPEHAHPDDGSEFEGMDFDKGGIHMPGQSWYPFLLALAVFIASYGVLYDNWPLAILMGLVVVASTYAWAFEGVGGHHVHPRSTAQEGAGD